MGVDLDRIDRRQTQSRQLGDVAENGVDQPAEARLPGQVGPIRRDVDAGQHDLGVTRFDQRPHLIDEDAHRHGAGIAAPERDDAERAAVVAAVLDLDEGAGPAVHPHHEMAGGLAHGHDVVDANARCPRRCRNRSSPREASRRCRGRGRPRAWRRRPPGRSGRRSRQPRSSAPDSRASPGGWSAAPGARPRRSPRRC